MIILLIIFCLIAVFLLLGMIGDKDANNRKNFTYGFCSLVIAIAIIAYKFI